MPYDSYQFLPEKWYNNKFLPEKGITQWAPRPDWLLPRVQATAGRSPELVSRCRAASAQNGTWKNWYQYISVNITFWAACFGLDIQYTEKPVPIYPHPSTPQHPEASPKPVGRAPAARVGPPEPRSVIYVFISLFGAFRTHLGLVLFRYEHISSLDFLRLWGHTWCYCSPNLNSIRCVLQNPASRSCQTSRSGTGTPVPSRLRTRVSKNVRKTFCL